ncbi:acyltransferase family protein [Oceaniglobus roseus]|uniref:acyltransferase family protein n=1 Tax=Oceaniglobus roseus TaxID=1737570 RepID=UPI000C7E89CA|nr:acyltransferase family protein [Kandeliimicrobium roseum]
MEYRPEIDGLRAVAVLPVILFHAGFSAFGGGFVGVDVFFVISGYLITSIIFEGRARGTFSMGRFYERRARRILPALFLVMLCCLPFAWAWMIPDRFEDFAKSFGSVPLFLSNFYFLSQTGYFMPDAETQPLLHTWSLAVEEQYYLLFPLLVALCARMGRGGVIAVFAVVAGLSLGLAEWGLAHHPERTFFFTGARLWELMAGSILAVALRSRPRPGNGMLAAFGLAAILAAVFLYQPDTPFPGVAALLPVLGTVLILACAAPGGLVTRLLSWRPMVAVGLVSYSAYLWHQPVFAFARIRSVGEPSSLAMLGLAALSLGLAALSWRFVEQPFRRAPVPLLRRRRVLFGAAGGVGVLFVAIGLLADNTAWFNASRTERQRAFLGWLGFAETQAFRDGYRFPDCFFGAEGHGFEAYRPETCLALDPERPNVLVLGDSHAAHLYTGLRRGFPGVNVLQATASACPPLSPRDGDPGCAALTALLRNEVLPRGGIDAVIVSARWQDGDFAGLPGVLAELQESVPRVVVFGPTAEYSPAAPEILATVPEGADYDAALQARLDPAVRARAERLAEVAEAAGVPFVDVLDTLCGGTGCRALAGPGVPVNWDYGHYTLDGSARVVEQMRDTGRLTPGMLGAEQAER